MLALLALLALLPALALLALLALLPALALLVGLSTLPRGGGGCVLCPQLVCPVDHSWLPPGLLGHVVLDGSLARRPRRPRRDHHLDLLHRHIVLDRRRNDAVSPPQHRLQTLNLGVQNVVGRIVQQHWDRLFAQKPHILLILRIIPLVLSVFVATKFARVRGHSRVVSPC